MRIGRTFGLLTLFAGLATLLATRAAMKRQDQLRHREVDDRLRWEGEGGATTDGPQAPGAQF
jgi:hypothetical protein